MSTIEVAIEYVLIGGLVMCGILGPFARDLPEVTSELAIAALGVAYLVGVVFDRIADSFLGPIEVRMRLRQAASNASSPSAPIVDHFPQDRLETDARSAEGGRLKWLDALRSRIRICRGLTVYGVPCIVGIVNGIGQERPTLVQEVALLVGIVAASAIAFDLHSWPKTSDIGAMKTFDGWWIAALIVYAGVVSFAVIELVPTGVRALDERPEIALACFGGLALTATSGFAWWRIVQTYFGALSSMMSHGDRVQ